MHEDLKTASICCNNLSYQIRYTLQISLKARIARQQKQMKSIGTSVRNVPTAT